MAETFVGTPATISPEIFLQQRYSYKTDIWCVAHHNGIRVLPYHTCACVLPHRKGIRVLPYHMSARVCATVSHVCVRVSLSVLHLVPLFESMFFMIFDCISDIDTHAVTRQTEK